MNQIFKKLNYFGLPCLLDAQIAFIAKPWAYDLEALNQSEIIQLDNWLRCPNL